MNKGQEKLDLQKSLPETSPWQEVIHPYFLQYKLSNSLTIKSSGENYSTNINMYQQLFLEKNHQITQQIQGMIDNIKRENKQSLKLINHDLKKLKSPESPQSSESILVEKVEKNLDKIVAISKEIKELVDFLTWF